MRPVRRATRRWPTGDAAFGGDGGGVTGVSGDLDGGDGFDAFRRGPPSRSPGGGT
jgi:hypothetical protein